MKVGPPLPRIDDLLETLSSSKNFSYLDFPSGYHQVEVNEEEHKKTDFATPFGVFESMVMTFGLFNSPATFQRLTSLLFAGVLGTTCLVYLEDFLLKDGC